MLIEIRSAEGGDHSKRLIETMAGIYHKVGIKNGFHVSTTSVSDGMITLKVDDRGARFFADEGGGHRWQGQSNGRIHTSTFTVAVLNELNSSKVIIRECDLEWKFCRSGGPGGQNVNKTSSAAQLRHIPTGILIDSRETRDQGKNRQRALEKLKQKLEEMQTNKHQTSTNASRNNQIGSGERGDKIRTYREKDDIVIDHRSNKKARLSDIMKGDWSKLKY